jgi:hypothetical protein
MEEALYLEGLREALRAAADLDAEQRHQDAADCLQKAIDAGRPAGSSMIALKVEECCQERDRQRMRESRLQAYLDA